MFIKMRDFAYFGFCDLFEKADFLASVSLDFFNENLCFYPISIAKSRIFMSIGCIPNISHRH